MEKIGRRHQRQQMNILLHIAIYFCQRHETPEQFVTICNPNLIFPLHHSSESPYLQHLTPS